MVFLALPIGGTEFSATKTTENQTGRRGRAMFHRWWFWVGILLWCCIIEKSLIKGRYVTWTNIFTKLCFRKSSKLQKMRDIMFFNFVKKENKTIKTGFTSVSLPRSTLVVPCPPVTWVRWGGTRFAGAWRNVPGFLGRVGISLKRIHKVLGNFTMCLWKGSRCSR